MKVILNKCFGGFRPSVFAYNEHARRNAKALFWYTLNVHIKGGVKVFEREL